MSVVGLDFGNINCVIASAGRGGVDVILNGNSNRLNPCMSAFTSSCRACGEGAASSATSNYKNTITSLKRLIGLKFQSKEAQEEITNYCPFECKETANGGVGVQVTYENNQTVIAVEQATAMMLSHMSSIASSANQGTVAQDWVMAVPSFYTDQRKRAFLDACEIVGINVQRLIHETTASALAFGIFKDVKKEFAADKPNNYMFVDVGQSSYQVTVVKYTEKKLTILSTQSDKNLGGRNFDYAIATWSADEFCAKYPKVADPRKNPKAWIKLLAASEKGKKTLSPAGVKEARLSVECLSEERDFSGILKSDKFEELVRPLLDRLSAPIERALKESGLETSDLTTVELVGGGTRVACLKKELCKILNLDEKSTANFGLSTTMNADEAVARGCALQSAILSPRFKVLPYEIVERQICDIVVSWDGEGMVGDEEENADGEPKADANSVVIFERGSNFPSVRRITLKKFEDFTVKASYGNNGDLDHSAPTDIAAFKINLMKNTDGVKVRVNVKQDVSGLITLSSAQSVEEVVGEVEAEGEKKEAGEESKMDVDAPAPAAEGEDATTPPPTDGATPPPADAAADAAAPTADAAAAAAAPVAPKKKVKKSNLTFTSTINSRLSKKDMDDAVEAEARMANADRVAQETAAKRNELEAYLYSMRDKMDMELKQYCTAEEAAATKKAIEDTEEWLYEDGFDTTKSVYSEKLAEVQKLGFPIEARQTEEAGRKASTATLKATIEECKQFVASNEPKYLHITDEERNVCREACIAAEGWLYDMIGKQGDVAPHQDPVLTIKMLNGKRAELKEKYEPIMHKVKPAPEKKKDETKSEGKEGETKEGGEAPMDADTPPEAPADVNMEEEPAVEPVSMDVE